MEFQLSSISIETFTGDAIGETFGNKALQQIIAMVKPLIQSGGLLGQKPTNVGIEVESLTRALVEATQAGPRAQSDWLESGRPAAALR